MAEQNDLNNDNPQPYNNKQQSTYQHLFLIEQPIQNQSNIEPLLPPDQLYVTPQINNANYFQTNLQNNNLKSLNDSHFINARLNNGNLSHKRKKLQIILIYILYLMGIICAFLFIYFLFLKRKLKNSFLIILIVSVLNIILASTMVYYTKKKQSSRTIPTSIFSFIVFLIIGIYVTIIIRDSAFHISVLYKFFGGVGVFEIFVIYNGILIISFYFFVFFFNLKTKCFKCCD